MQHLVQTAQRWLAGISLTLISCTGVSSVHAEDVVSLVVPFAAGSYTDNVARLIAPGMAEHLGKNVIIENRAGANGIIGASFVARAKPDGLTLLVGGASVNTINPSIYKDLPFDPEHDLLPVARIGVLPFMLLVHPSLPIQSVDELIKYAQGNPDKLAYGTPNAATLVGTETLKQKAGIKLLSVPYKSSPQAMTDLVGNQIQVLMADFATAMPQVKAEKARLLAVTMKDRSPLLPETPPISETVSGFDLSAWTGLLAPANTPKEALQPIYEALRAAVSDPATKEKFKSIGFDIAPMGPDEFGPYIRAEIKNWDLLARQAGIEPQ